MWTGRMPAVTAKFAVDGGPDHAGMERCLALRIAAGHAGLIFCGTPGGGNMLSHDKRLTVPKIAKPVTARKSALLSIPKPGTREAPALAARAAKAGAVVRDRIACRPALPKLAA